ncbi:hypothetical protein JW906_05400 [bacterium]|nr:hypothetical protein [bacterium]
MKRILLMAIAFGCVAGLFAQTDPSFLINHSRAGLAEIGIPVDELYNRYGRDNTALVDLYQEGMFSPAMEIRIPGSAGGKPSLLVEIGWNEGWTVSRITVTDARFRTDKGIGPGSTLGELRKSHGVDRIGFGEGGLVAGVDALDLSFMLDRKEVPQKWYATRDPALIPDSAQVVKVLVY